MGCGVLSVTVPNLLPSSGFAPLYILPARAAGVRQPYQIFMRLKWRCKLGVPMLMAEDGAPSLIFAME
jgi:hypothetical protein